MRPIEGVFDLDGMTDAHSPVSWPLVLWYAGVALIVLGSVVSLARLVGLMWAGHYHKIFIPLVMGAAAITLLQRVNRLRIDPLGFCLFVVIPFASIIGVLQGGEPRFFVSHLSAAVFALLLYMVGRNANWDEGKIETFWKISSYLIVAAFIVAIGAFWIIRAVTGTSLYLGVGTGDLIFPLAYFLAYKQYRYALLTLVLFMLSGKRGPLVAALVLVLLHMPLPGRCRLATRVAFVAGTALLIVLVSFAAEPLVKALALPSFIMEILDKWYMANFFNENFNIDHAFSGRNQELVLSFAAFATQIQHWFIGMGYGWSYFFDAVIQGSATTNFRVHYVHMSPANLVLLYGVPITSLFFVLVWLTLSRAYAYSASVTERPMVRVLVLFWLGSFVSSLSGYSYPTDPLFWLVLGALARLPQQHKASRMAQCAA